MMGTTDWLAAGTRIGDYVIERELAAKPGLVAWSARHSLLPRRARISTVHPAFTGAQAIAAQLTREACVLEVLRHAGVPRVFECGQLPDGRPWIATELIEGPSLSLLLAEEARLGVPMVLALLAGISEILHYAHTRGLVHRNLRPDAIASRPEGPCIVDWSDARERNSDELQLAPSDWLAYQPPEVVAGDPADSRADVFALGVIAYQALAGGRQVPAGARWFAAVPPRLTALLDRMVARDAFVRPTSAEVRAEALAIVEQIEVPLPPPGDEYGGDVQVEEVELLADESDVEPPAASPKGSLTWKPVSVDDRTPTRTMAPAAELDLARTTTEPMKPEHLVLTEQLSRTKTEEMSAEPEPRPSRTSTRMVRHALPPRIVGPSRTKTP